MDRQFGIEQVAASHRTIRTPYRIWNKKSGTIWATIPEIIAALASYGGIECELDATDDTQRLAELESSHAVLREQVREIAGWVEKQKNRGEGVTWIRR